MSADGANATYGNQAPNPCVDRQKKLAQIMLNIEKAYGKGAAVRLRDQEQQAIAVIPTGSLALDVALGVGGLPRGRIVEIQGGDASGKTTLALHAIAEAQKLGGVGVFIDAEHALDAGHARSVGVAADSVIISRPNCAEEALSIANAFTRNGVVDVIVIDSVAALVPNAEIDGDIGESFAGLQAKLMSQALRTLAGAASRTNTVIIFINQMREKIDATLSNPEVTSGGNALRYYASIILDARKMEAIKSGCNVVGDRVRVKVLKNKVAPPSRFADIEIIYGEGISRPAAILDAGQELLLIEKSGSSFISGDHRLGSGREKAKHYLGEHPDLMDEIERQIRQKLAGSSRIGAGASE